MEKKKIEIIITASLVPILIFILYKNISGAGKKELQAQEPVAQVPNQNTILNNSREQEIEKVNALSWGRDPFILGETKMVEGGIVLNGIAWDEKSPSAVINSSVVKIGDEINGNKVLDIQKQKVILTNGASTYELNLLQRSTE